MKPEQQKKLYEKYPEIFCDVGKSPQETCMAWGVETSDGWYNLLDELCDNIQKRVNEVSCPQVVALQVKEKFGTLRFYFIGGDQFIDALVIDAEKRSEKICEECGKPGKLIDDGWLKVRCEDCNAKKD